MGPSCSTEAGTEAALSAAKIPTRFEHLLPILLTQGLAAQELGARKAAGWNSCEEEREGLSDGRSTIWAHGRAVCDTQERALLHQCELEVMVGKGLSTGSLSCSEMSLLLQAPHSSSTAKTPA